MKNSLSRRLFQKYGLPPRGYQWGATSFLPTQGMWRRLPCFPGAKATILSRIRNIFAEGGLRQDATVAKFATTSTDEITNQDVYYNSAGIISAGYRVKSLWGTRLCI